MPDLFPASPASAASAIELVIFDCDGVLIDSERIFNRIFAAHLRGLGAEVDLEYMFEHFVGNSWDHCIGKITGLLGCAPPDDLKHAVWTEARTAFRDELAAIPGIAAALDRIPHPICVASNSGPEELRVNLGMVGLLSRFGDRIFSAKQVARSKPAPDVYLLAASTLGVQPSKCLVIEDSPVGVAAGVAAGMKVMGYCAHTPAHRLREAGAHPLFKDMRDLPGLISSAA